MPGLDNAVMRSHLRCVPVLPALDAGFNQGSLRCFVRAGGEPVRFGKRVFGQPRPGKGARVLVMWEQGTSTGQSALRVATAPRKHDAFHRESADILKHTPVR